MNERCVGLLGATSLVGASLLPLLTQAGWQITAFSRQPARPADSDITWRQLSSHSEPGHIPYWICVAPVWALPEYFTMLEGYGARRLVALSSTSLFIKRDSSDPGEQNNARQLAEGENALRAWAEAKGIEWVILRPTLIYGHGRDKNITEIARFIRWFGFFPLLGPAHGLRQPVHAEDVASACLSALSTPAATNRAYNISGGQTLAYRDMVSRIFIALGDRPRLVTVPLWMFRIAITILHGLPRYRHWTKAMAERMSRDLVFDHADATRDFNFSPRIFQLSKADLPG